MDCPFCSTHLKDYMHYCWNCGTQVLDHQVHPIPEINHAISLAINSIHKNPRGITDQTFLERALRLLRARGIRGVRRTELNLTSSQTEKAHSVFIVSAKERIETVGRFLEGEKTYRII